jgi:hypothetical protein
MSAVHEWDEADYDERFWVYVISNHTGLDVLTVTSLVRWCEQRLSEQGIHGVRVVESRSNEAGEAIGPDIRISFRFEMLLASVANAVAAARDAAMEAELKRWSS